MHFHAEYTKTLRSVILNVNDSGTTYCGIRYNKIPFIVKWKGSLKLRQQNVTHKTQFQ